MIPLPDWDHPVYTIDTDEAFRELEQPKPKYIYDDYTLPPTLVNKDTYPENHDAWTPGRIGGRHG